MAREVFEPNGGMRDPAGFLLYGAVVTNLLRAKTVTIGNTATAIPSSALTSRKILWFKNFSSQIIYIGASDVDSTNGYPLDPRDQGALMLNEGMTLYGICASGGADLRIFEGS